LKEPVDHILRTSLPWRAPDAGTITECGYDASQVKSITRGQFFQRSRDLGSRRTAMLTCMTCADTAGRWGTWEDDPRMAIEREIMWEGNGRYSRDDRGQRLKDELLAIADLIEAHRGEFEASIALREQRRDWLEKKEALEKKPKPPPMRLL
jgi:hypothetical protein